MDKSVIWFVALLVPVISSYLSLQILFTPVFLKWEYSCERLPNDTYGFTSKDRLRWGSAILYYLNESNTEGYLESLTIKNGSKLLNKRERDHLKDVKELLNKITMFFFIFFFILATILIFRFNISLFFRGLKLGGRLTIFLIIFFSIIVFLAMIASKFARFTSIFENFFRHFHYLFFEGDSWLFYESDTLIRLFPLKFWQDATIWFFALIFILTILITCISSLVLKCIHPRVCKKLR